MNGYILDTNVVTAHLKNNPLVAQRIRDAEAAGRSVMLNAVSYYETRRGLLFAGAHAQLAAFERLWRIMPSRTDKAYAPREGSRDTATRGTHCYLA